MELHWRLEYISDQAKDISPAPFHYAPRTEIPLAMTAKQFYDAAQGGPLSEILPEEVKDGEIIEIDDGLQPYYFYKLDYATVIPLPYFRLKGEKP